jgi:NIMA (never in mitosis gene a)-related kinase 2
MASLSPPFTADNQLALALKIKQGTFQRIPSRYSEELMRTIRWMLKPEPKDRPNVEDLLNLPHVSMRLRERALKKNYYHMKKKEEEVVKKEQELLDREAELQRREKELEEKERQVEELERAVAEMQRLKKYSGGGSSTTPGTDLGNDSCMKATGGLAN